MTHFCSSHRFPYAGRHPIDDAAARLLFESTLAVPRRPETVAVLLDHERCGRSIINVDRTDDPDAVFEVAELCIAMANGSPEIGGVLIASVRPAGVTSSTTSTISTDVERWLELDQWFALAGIELVEWYVYGRSVVAATRAARRTRAVGGLSRPARGQPVRARRSAGLRRSPAARSRRTSSRLSTTSCAGGDHVVAILLGDVVVVALESTPGDPDTHRRSRAVRRTTRRTRGDTTSDPGTTSELRP